jgi:hypothetical protein
MRNVQRFKLRNRSSRSTPPPLLTSTAPRSATLVQHEAVRRRSEERFERFERLEGFEPSLSEPQRAAAFAWIRAADEGARVRVNQNHMSAAEAFR